MFGFVLCVQSHDSDCTPLKFNIGRLDYGNMSDQLLMEKLIENIDHKEIFMKSRFIKNIFGVHNTKYKEVCDWPGVKCDDEGVHVLEITWGYKHLRGTMDLCWIPPTVTRFSIGYVRNVSMDGVAGTLDTSAQLVTTCGEVNS